MMSKERVKKVLERYLRERKNEVGRNNANQSSYAKLVGSIGCPERHREDPLDVTLALELLLKEGGVL